MVSFIFYYFLFLLALQSNIPKNTSSGIIVLNYMKKGIVSPEMGVSQMKISTAKINQNLVVDVGVSFCMLGV